MRKSHILCENHARFCVLLRKIFKLTNAPFNDIMTSLGLLGELECVLYVLGGRGSGVRLFESLESLDDLSENLRGLLGVLRHILRRLAGGDGSHAVRRHRLHFLLDLGQRLELVDHLLSVSVGRLRIRNRL